MGGSVEELIIIVIAYRFTSFLLPWVSLPPSVSGCSTLYILHYRGAWDLPALSCSAMDSFWALHLHYITVQPGTYRTCPAALRAVSEHYITMEPGTYRTCLEAPRAVSEHYITLEPGTYWPWPAAPRAVSEHYITLEPGTYWPWPAAPRAVSEHYITLEPGTYWPWPAAPRAVSEHYITLEPGTYWPWPAAPWAVSEPYIYITLHWSLGPTAFGLQHHEQFLSLTFTLHYTGAWDLPPLACSTMSSFWALHLHYITLEPGTYRLWPAAPWAVSELYIYITLHWSLGTIGLSLQCHEQFLNITLHWSLGLTGLVLQLWGQFLNITLHYNRAWDLPDLSCSSEGSFWTLRYITLEPGTYRTCLEALRAVSEHYVTLHWSLGLTGLVLKLWGQFLNITLHYTGAWDLPDLSCSSEGSFWTLRYITLEPGTYRTCLEALRAVSEHYVTLHWSLGLTGLVLQLWGQFLNITLHYTGAWDLPDLSWSSEGSFWTLRYITLEPGTYRTCLEALRAVSEHYVTLEPGTYRTCLEALRAVSEHYVTLHWSLGLTGLVLKLWGQFLNITLHWSLGLTGLVLKLWGQFLNITLHYTGAWDLPDLSWSSEGSFWTLRYTGAWDLPDLSWSSEGSFWTLRYITLEPGTYRTCLEALRAVSEHYVTLEPGTYRTCLEALRAVSEHYVTLHWSLGLTGLVLKLWGQFLNITLHWSLGLTGLVLKLWGQFLNITLHYTGAWDLPDLSWSSEGSFWTLRYITIEPGAYRTCLAALRAVSEHYVTLHWSLGLTGLVLKLWGQFLNITLHYNRAWGLPDLSCSSEGSFWTLRYITLEPGTYRTCLEALRAVSEHYVTLEPGTYRP